MYCLYLRHSLFFFVFFPFFYNTSLYLKKIKYRLLISTVFFFIVDGLFSFNVCLYTNNLLLDFLFWFFLFFQLLRLDIETERTQQLNRSDHSRVVSKSRLTGWMNVLNLIWKPVSGTTGSLTLSRTAKIDLRFSSLPWCTIWVISREIEFPWNLRSSRVPSSVKYSSSVSPSNWGVMKSHAEQRQYGFDCENSKLLSYALGILVDNRSGPTTGRNNILFFLNSQ